MIMADGTLRVIEFNCRMGDPETQPILMRLKSDLAAICWSTLEGTLGEHKAEWDERAALGVVMAAGGYPQSYAKGNPIKGLDDVDSDTQKVFHAGTAVKNDTVVSNGGRVLCVVGLGESVKDAAAQAYAAVDKIHWDDVFWRRDIGHRAIAREDK
jgi:phosphoribosylamine--glycine ligase